MWPYSLKLVFLIELLETIVISRSLSFKKQNKQTKETQNKPPPLCANFLAMTSEFHSSWYCVLFSWRYLSNLINKTRLHEGWPVHMKTKCKDQGDTCDCRTLTEKKRTWFQWECHCSHLDSWWRRCPRLHYPTHNKSMIFQGSFSQPKSRGKEGKECKVPDFLKP